MDNSPEFQRIQLEGNAEMVSNMMRVCREKTLKKSHGSDQLSDTEKTQFNNCIMKFFEAPNHVMSAMQGMGGQM